MTLILPFPLPLSIICFILSFFFSSQMRCLSIWNKTWMKWGAMTNYRTMTGIITKLQIPRPSRKTVFFLLIDIKFETWREDTQAVNDCKKVKTSPPGLFLDNHNITWKWRGRSFNKFPMAQATKFNEKHTMRWVEEWLEQFGSWKN